MLRRILLGNARRCLFHCMVGLFTILIRCCIVPAISSYIGRLLFQVVGTVRPRGPLLRRLLMMMDAVHGRLRKRLKYQSRPTSSRACQNDVTGGGVCNAVSLISFHSQRAWAPKPKVARQDGLPGGGPMIQCQPHAVVSPPESRNQATAPKLALPGLRQSAKPLRVFTRLGTIPRQAAHVILGVGHLDIIFIAARA